MLDPAVSEGIIRVIEDSLGQIVHSAFRKGCDSAEAVDIWRAINDLDDKDWSNAIYYMTNCLANSVGYVEWDELVEAMEEERES
ncbi:unnamed protein product [marine sediment metagenome]|uniref:Uncharacterized protein n=1 Tax=marine sediment metagenome TaxID=412755 RepID=X0VDM8_9ZZZZ